MLKYFRWYIIVTVLLSAASCRKPGNASTAFYYWKTGFNLNQQQAALLKQTGNNAYIRFFDVSWNEKEQRSYPNAVVQLNEIPVGINLTPVIYITNKTFENTADTALATLAGHCNKLINDLAEEKKINYTKVQVDCDWSLSTRFKYFNFLATFKKLNQKQLEVTIRLHQVKFKERTGVPPADRGVLMFYNMGKLNAGLHQPNSIYNEEDAGKYIDYLSTYPLKLDIALPLFSWSIHIRNGRVIQVYGKIGRPQLADHSHFEPIEGPANYRAVTSFFMDGIYVKQNDIFKLEETDANTLKTAAKQVMQHLPKQQQTTIIYYELANINLAKFNQETITQISARFSLCTLAIAGVIWACADSYEEEYSVFTPEYFVNKQYSPFFYTGNEVYYGLGYTDGSNTWYNDIIVDEWYEHFNHQFNKASLQYLLLKASAGAIDSVHRKATGALKVLPAKYPAIVTGNVSAKMLNGFYSYLKLAKNSEDYSVNDQYYSWDKVKPNHSPVNLGPTLVSAYNNETDPFVKERLWFQMVRYYYFLDENSSARAVKMFDQFKDHFPKNLIYYRTLGYVAGYYYRQKNYALSNYLYSLCYDYTYKLKIPSFWSFHPQNENDWNATLKLAKSPEEKITLWHMLGVQYDAARAIRTISAINPKSEKLDLLLSRLINIREAETGGGKPADSVKKVDDNGKRLVESIALKNNTAKPYYWNLAAGYLNFLDSNYTATAKFYAAAKNQFPAGDKMIVAQAKLLDLMLYVKGLKKMDAIAESKLIEPLNWLANLRDNKLKIKDLRFDNAISVCNLAIARLYKKQGNAIREVCFNNSAQDFYTDSARVQHMIDLLNKPDKTAFEQAMLRYYPTTLNNLYYHQAVALAYQQKLPEAIAQLKKMKPEDFVLAGNPFTGRLVDCHDCDHAAPQKAKFTPLSFLQALYTMATEIKQGKNVYRNAYAAANAYYNITYYGNARLFYESDVVATGPSSRYYYEGEPKMDDKLISMQIAVKYYQLARENAATDEQRARCTFMLSKCALNEIYNDPNFKGADKFADIKASQPVIDAYYKYFAELKERYRNTAYYKEALKECGYFNDYANKK